MKEKTLVLMAGLPGSGKSTLARTLAAELGGVVLDKDQIRAALFPAELIEYSQRQDDFCMELLLQTAGYLARQTGIPFVFVDGRPFVFRQQMKDVTVKGEQIGYRVRTILTVCSDEAAQQRLAQEHSAANRNYHLYQTLKAKFEPIEDDHLAVNTEQPVASSVAIAKAYLTAADQ